MADKLIHNEDTQNYPFCILQLVVEMFWPLFDMNQPIIIDKADKLMYIPNDYTQSYPFCRLQLVIQTFKDSTKWTKQLKLVIEELLLKTFVFNEEKNALEYRTLKG